MNRLLHFKQLRARCARPVGDGVLHGDLCPRLTLHAVGFSIPPRALRVEPSFDPDGRARVRVRSSGDFDAQARALFKLAPLETQTCPRCGQGVGGQIRLDNKGEFLAACFGLAGRLLRRQYDLSDEQLADLLAFDTDQPPQWIAQLLAWAAGQNVQSADAPPAQPLARPNWISRLVRGMRQYFRSRGNSGIPA